MASKSERCECSSEKMWLVSGTTESSTPRARQRSGSPRSAVLPKYPMKVGWYDELFRKRTFCPLASGILTDKYLDGKVPAKSRAAERWGEEWAKRNLSPERLKVLNELNGMAKKRGQTLAQMTLAWTLRLPEITSALIGASALSQIQENVAALDNMEFSEEELKRIDELAPAI